jgi:hypothetical protein
MSQKKLWTTARRDKLSLSLITRVAIEDLMMSLLQFFCQVLRSKQVKDGLSALLLEMIHAKDKSWLLSAPRTQSRLHSKLNSMKLPWI